jgi:hypothetical protein
MNYYLIAERHKPFSKTGEKYGVLGTFQIPIKLGHGAALRFETLKRAEEVRADFYKNRKQSNIAHRWSAWEPDYKQVFVANESYYKKLCVEFGCEFTRPKSGYK